MKIKLSQKLTLILVAAAIIPLAIAGFQSIRTFERWASAEQQEELEEQFRLFNTFVEQHRASVIERLNRFSDDPNVSVMVANKSRSALLNSGITYSQDMEADAFYIVSDDENLQFDVVQMNWGSIAPAYDFYIALALSHQSTSSLMLDPDFGLGIVASRPIRNQHGTAVGAVAAFVPFSAHWMSVLKDITEFDFTILTNDRRSAMSTLAPNNEKFPLPETESNFEPLLVVDMLGDKYAALEGPLTDISGDEIGSILITRSLRPFIATIKDVLNEVFLIATLTFLAVILVATFFSRQITAPLSDLVMATKRISLQDYEVDIEVKGGDEVGQLAASFGHMVQRLRETSDDLAAATRELEQRVQDRTTELRAAQSELIRKERLATVGQVTATVSHELRNPLGAIRSASDAITKIAAGSDPQLDRALALLERSQTRCDRVITELLDYTRVQELDRSTVSVDEWLDVLLDDYQVPAGITLRRELNAGINIAVDRDRLERAVLNVMDNACQAMQGDGTRHHGTRDQQMIVTSRATGQRLELSIKDTGPGIAPDSQENVFEPLYSSKSFGVGLGLPMVKQILEQHDGGVELNADSSQGAEFMLWVPRNEVEQKRG